MKREIKSFAMSILLVITFTLVIFSLQSNLKNEITQLSEKLRVIGLNNYKTLSDLTSENLSKGWDIYSKKLTFQKINLKDVLFKEEEETSRRRRATTQKDESDSVINVFDFLGIISHALIQDMKIILPAFLISIFFAMSLPLVFVKDTRLSSFIPQSITYIPPFLIIVLLFYFASSSKFLIILAFGILASTRLGIQLSNSVRSVENDDYVIYMMLGGSSRHSITMKYTYFELLDSIIWGSLWTFYTLFSLKIAMDSLSLNAEFEVNTGAILMGIFSQLPAPHALIQFSVLVSLIALLFIISFNIANKSVLLYSAAIGIKKAKKKKLKQNFEQKDLKKIDPENIQVNSDKFSKIVVKNLNIYPKNQESQKPILSVEKDIEINPGDKVFVKGPSGSGKTLLTNALVGMLWDKKLQYFGEIIYQFEGYDIDILNNKKMRQKILKSELLEFVPQNPKHGFNPYRTVKEQIEDFNLMNQFEELLKEYFPNIFDRVIKSINLPPSKINDGALQVINFVLTVARMRGKRGIILFDEPIASLSKENTKRVYNMLKNTVWDNEHIIIWIGHELETLEELAFDKILSFEESQDVMTAKIYELNQEFIDNYKKKVNTLIGELNELIRRQRLKHENINKNILYDVNVKKITFKHQEISPSSKFVVNTGDIVFIRGENGSGKTTMIKAIVGYLRKEVKGEIVWFYNGKKLLINKSSFKKLQELYWKQVDAIFQNPDASVPKYLKITPKNFKNSKDNSENSFEELLQKYNLKGCYNKRFYQLSYGQKKRIKLLRVVLRQPSVILLDEPTASLDIDNIELFVRSISDILKNNPGTSLFIVTHQDIFQRILSNEVKIIDMRNHTKN